MEMARKLKLKNKGFTLVELIIAIAVFGFLIVSVTNVGISIIKSQRKAFALQEVQESARYVLETMAKEIRTSEVNTSAGSGLDTLNITNADSETLDYAFNDIDKTLERDEEAITPDDIEVIGAFYVRKNYSPEQVAVTVVLKIQAEGSKTEEQAEIYLQNTISPRAY